MISYKHRKNHCHANFVSLFWNIYTIPDIEFHICYRYDPSLDPYRYFEYLDLLANSIGVTIALLIFRLKSNLSYWFIIFSP